MRVLELPLTYDVIQIDYIKASCINVVVKIKPFFTEQKAI